LFAEGTDQLLVSPKNKGNPMRDIILLVARRGGRLGLGKLTRSVYLPSFRRAVNRKGRRLYIYKNEEHLRERQHHDPVVILVYNEIYLNLAQSLESVVNDLHPNAIIFNSTRAAKIIRDKRATNRAYQRS